MRVIGQEEAKGFPALVKVHVPSSAWVDGLLAADLDLAEYVARSATGTEVHAVITAPELARLAELGYSATEVLSVSADWEARKQEREATLARERAVLAADDTVAIQRADFCQTVSGACVHVEATSTAGSAPGVILTARWDAGPGTEPGSGGNIILGREVDASGYSCHRLIVSVSAQPAFVRVQSSQGGSASASVVARSGQDLLRDPSRHFVTGFVSHYLHPTELTERIQRLAQEFPDLCEVIDLPYETDGYRRKAQVILGDNQDAMIVVTSVAWGDKGGNKLSIEVLAQAVPDQSLSISVTDNLITVRLASDAEGNWSSTASEVVGALNAHAGDLVFAHLDGDSSGSGRMTPREAGNLVDHLTAPAEISREPFRVRALRIGKHRDGTRVGVLAYAQEHAREWVPPLVIMETAERLLRNYSHDEQTRSLVDGFDLFLVACANPDGSHYTFFDYPMQRKNLVYHGGVPHLDHDDPDYRNFWGVDPNRNCSVGSVYDGFAGASTRCLSSVYAGLAKFSEAESRNLAWLAESYPGIKFAVNIHSYGGYLMWPPGSSRKTAGEKLARLTPEQEAFFRDSSDRMASAIRNHRGTTLRSDRIGAGVDVLYPAAGNSADYLWYERGIFAWSCEVGADRPNVITGLPVPVGFQPPFAEAFDEAMEFADGLVALCEVAHDYVP